MTRAVAARNLGDKVPAACRSTGGPGLDLAVRRVAGRWFPGGWCCYAPGTPEQLAADRVRQGLAAGLVSGGVGALFVTVLGTGTTALLVKSAWARGVLFRGQHLTAATVYGRELFAAQNVTGYFNSLRCLSDYRARDGPDRRGGGQRDPPDAGRRRPGRPAGA